MTPAPPLPPHHPTHITRARGRERAPLPPPTPHTSPWARVQERSPPPSPPAHTHHPEPEVGKEAQWRTGTKITNEKKHAKSNCRRDGRWRETLNARTKFQETCTKTRGHLKNVHRRKCNSGTRTQLCLPYSTVPVPQLREARRRAGSLIAVYAPVQCWEPKTGQEKVQFYYEEWRRFIFPIFLLFIYDFYWWLSLQKVRETKLSLPQIKIIKIYLD